MPQLDNKTWMNIFGNLQNHGGEVEVSMLDGSDEWSLNHGYEILEDGFRTEKEARDRLTFLENTLL